MQRFLSRPEVAEHIGVKPDTMNRYRMPEPDAMIGRLAGWTVETIDAWNAARPGRGRRQVESEGTNAAE